MYGADVREGVHGFKNSILDSCLSRHDLRTGGSEAIRLYRYRADWRTGGYLYSQRTCTTFTDFHCCNNGFGNTVLDIFRTSAYCYAKHAGLRHSDDIPFHCQCRTPSLGIPTDVCRGENVRIRIGSNTL